LRAATRGAAAVAASASRRRADERGLSPGSRVAVDGVGTAAVIVALAVVTAPVVLPLVIATGEGASEEDGSGPANDRSAVESTLATGPGSD
jgi:hypothetical protein